MPARRGIGEACLAPASFSIVADMIRPQRRGLAMGLLISGTSLGSAASVLLGGAILQAFAGQDSVTLPLVGAIAPWQLVFFVVGAPGLLFSILLFSFKEPARRERSKATSPTSFMAYVSKHRQTFVLTYAAFSCNAIFGYVTSAWIAAILLRVHHVPPGELGVSMAWIFILAGPAAAAFSGVLGDWLAKRSPNDGRLGIVQILPALQAALMIIWWFYDSPAISLAVFAASGPLLSAMISASCYPALNQFTPNELRGQGVAAFVLVSNLTGLGVAPTAVALVTDYVFKDPMMVRQSVILVAAPIAMLGFVCALLARRHFRQTVLETTADPEPAYAEAAA